MTTVPTAACKLGSSAYCCFYGLHAAVRKGSDDSTCSVLSEKDSNPRQGSHRSNCLPPSMTYVEQPAALSLQLMAHLTPPVTTLLLCKLFSGLCCPRMPPCREHPAPSTQPVAVLSTLHLLLRYHRLLMSYMFILDTTTGRVALLCVHPEATVDNLPSASLTAAILQLI